MNGDLRVQELNVIDVVKMGVRKKNSVNLWFCIRKISKSQLLFGVESSYSRKQTKFKIVS